MKNGMKILAGALAALVALAIVIPSLYRTDAPPPAPATDTTAVWLVRHAEKADDGTPNPPLTAEGEARAQRLAERLASEGITAIYSTEFKRTLSTARPLAERLGLAMQLYDPMNPNVVAQIAKQHPGGRILVVGHSNTVPPMANVLLGEARYEQFEPGEYGRLLCVRLPKAGPAEAYELAY
jgi:broad specificity phosphatase PhoE